MSRINVQNPSVKLNCGYSTDEYDKMQTADETKKREAWSKEKREGGMMKNREDRAGDEGETLPSSGCADR